MASGMYETWGLSTNEAMCFGLPIILSDMVGSAYDLIDGNGVSYPSGDYRALSKHIHHIFSLSDSDFQTMRQRSKTIIERYSYEAIIEGIKTAAHQTDLNRAFTPHNSHV
jgi:glycosyltransferase involved in cell wall biosynthesis